MNENIQKNLKENSEKGFSDRNKYVKIKTKLEMVFKYNN